MTISGFNFHSESYLHRYFFKILIMIFCGILKITGCNRYKKHHGFWEKSRGCNYFLNSRNLRTIAIENPIMRIPVPSHNTLIIGFSIALMITQSF